jgi:hypothetical protein
MNDVLSAVADLMQFPRDIATPCTPDYFDRCAEQDAKRDAYVQEVAPHLVRVFAATPARLAKACGGIVLADNNALLAALLVRDDHAEIGRLLLAMVDAELKQAAEDAAEEVGYDLFPEPEL